MTDHLARYATTIMSVCLQSADVRSSSDNFQRAALREALVYLATDDIQAAASVLADAVMLAYRPHIVEDRVESHAAALAFALLTVDMFNGDDGMEWRA